MSSTVERSDRFVKLLTYIFVGFGGFMVVSGLAMAFIEPGALFLCVFGAVFAGIGYLVPRGFAVPKVKMTVILSSTAAQTGIRTPILTIPSHMAAIAPDEAREASRLY